MKKKIVLVLIVLAMVAGIGFWQKEKHITICVSSDLHYLSPSLTDNGPYFMDMIEKADGKAMPYCEEITDGFITQVLKEKPDVLILSGDLTFNGEKKSHEDLAGKLAKVRKAGIPVLVLPGNHDLYSNVAESFSGNTRKHVSSVTGEEFAEIYHDCGYGDALSRDSSSLSYTYRLNSHLWILLVDVNTVTSPGKLTDDTYDWVKKQLKQAEKEGASLVAVSHQNVLSQNRQFENSYTIDGHEKLKKLYEKYHVICNFSGHVHVQHIAESEKGLVDIASSSLLVSPNQFGVMNLSEKEADYHTEKVSFDHEKEAEKLMYDTSFVKAKEDIDNATDEMCDYFARMNMAYFAGRADQMEWNPKLNKEIKERSSFLGAYMQSIQDEDSVNQTEFSFKIR